MELSGSSGNIGGKRALLQCYHFPFRLPGQRQNNKISQTIMAEIVVCCRESLLRIMPLKQGEFTIRQIPKLTKTEKT